MNAASGDRDTRKDTFRWLRRSAPITTESEMGAQGAFYRSLLKHRRDFRMARTSCAPSPGMRCFANDTKKDAGEVRLIAKAAYYGYTRERLI